MSKALATTSNMYPSNAGICCFSSSSIFISGILSSSLILSSSIFMLRSNASGSEKIIFIPLKLNIFLYVVPICEIFRE
jgi:hypothetical protein